MLLAPPTIVIPGCAFLGAGPESITTIMSMDSLMCNGTSKLAASPRPGMTVKGGNDAPTHFPPAALNLAAPAVTYHWACCDIGAEEEA